MKQRSHLRQQETYRWSCYRSSTDKRHHAIAVYGAVHLAVGRQHDPWRAEARLAHGTAAALEAAWQKQRAPAAVALLKGAVLVVGEVVLRAHVACAAAEAEQAGAAVSSRWEEGSTDTEERLREAGREKQGKWGREREEMGRQRRRNKKRWAWSLPRNVSLSKIPQTCKNVDFMWSMN